MAAGCLDDATFDDLLGGLLGGDALRETEAHLDRCPTCSDVITVLAGGSLDRELVTGARVGRFEVIEAIGRGAMGVVYLAHDPELERRVALKLIRPGASPEISERMLGEAQAMARLSHPNVVAIYDVGRDSDGSIHLAMEYVAGCNLRTWLKQAPRTVEEILAAYVQAGRGLSAAHRAGIVHRDFKPDNVLVGDDGRVRVTDFGLALADTDSTERAGTPAYMAPEQHAGVEATPQSDQFSFAVSVLEALSKKRVPKRILGVLSRALSARPEARHPSLDVLLAELEPRRSSLLWLAVASATAALIVGAVLLVPRAAPDACGAGAEKLGAVWSPDIRTRIEQSFGAADAELGAIAAKHVLPRLDSYAASFATEHRAICEATHVRHEQSDALLDARMRCLDRGFVAFSELTGTFSRSDAAIVRGATEATLELPALSECAKLEPPAGGDARPTDPAIVARLDRVERELTRARTQATAGRYSEAKQTLRAVESESAYRPLAAELRLLSAFLARKSGDFELAAQKARSALSLAEAARSERTSAAAWVELLAIDGARGRPRTVIENAEVASAIVTRAGDPVELRLGLLSALGAAHTSIGELSRASEELELALALVKREVAPSIFFSRVSTLLGNLARARGKLDEALRLHERARAFDADVLGASHPALATHHHNIAGVLRLAGRRDEALTSYARALELEKRAFGDQHPAVALTENSIAIALIEQGNLARAREHLARALGILEAKKHPDRALVLVNFGLADAAEKRWPEAIDRFTRAIDILRAQLGPDAERIAGVLAERAEAELARGQPALALEDRKEARRILELHVEDSAEARKLRDELDQAPRTPKPKQKRPVLGSTSYGSQAN